MNELLVYWNTYSSWIHWNVVRAYGLLVHSHQPCSHYCVSTFGLFACMKWIYIYLIIYLFIFRYFSFGQSENAQAQAHVIIVIKAKPYHLTHETQTIIVNNVAKWNRWTDARFNRIIVLKNVNLQRFIYINYCYLSLQPSTYTLVYRLDFYQIEYFDHCSTIELNYGQSASIPILYTHTSFTQCKWD